MHRLFILLNVQIGLLHLAVIAAYVAVNTAVLSIYMLSLSASQD